MGLRSAMSSAASLLPDGGAPLKRLYWSWWGTRRARLLARHAASSGWRLPDPGLVLVIAPDLVVKHTNHRPDGELREVRNRNFRSDVLPGSVLDGDWDLDCPPFESLAAFQSIRDRVRENVPWRETAYFAESMRDIEGGRPLWNCHNADELEARLHYVDSLVESIRQHGLLLQRNVGRTQDPTGRYSDETEVNISRDGEFLFQDGRHRMCIAKVLGLPAIPVKVVVRHLQWQRFREVLFDLCQNSEPADGSRRLPQPAPHPDLGDIPAHPAAARALERVLPALAGRRACVLDVGCRLGFFGDALAAAGHGVRAVEGDALWHGHAARIQTYHPRQFELLQALPAHPGASEPFDTIVAMGNAPGWHFTEHDLTALHAGLAQAVGAGAAPDVYMMVAGTHDRPELPAPVRDAVARGTLAPPRVSSTLPGGRILVHLPGSRPARQTQPTP